jgi:C4-dicarboxylate-specific signal transduction histidine kinase
MIPSFAHPAQISQMIINLGTNAMQAMEDKNGVIDLSVKPVLNEKKQDFIKISMKDTGCGMNKETLENMSPFLQQNPRGWEQVLA